MIPLRPPISGQQRTVLYGSRSIKYELVFVEAESLAITVYPELRVRVRVPAGRDPQEVDQRVRKRAPWIIRQQEFFRQFLPLQPERRYVSGESHYYLGRQYRLKVLKSEDTGSVQLKGRYLWVYTPDKDDIGKIGTQLDDWYRQRAKELFHRHMDRCFAKVSKYGIKQAPLRIQRMKSRWGSYTLAGTIILNLALIKTPIHCIDYVITHELCHTIEPHHGPAFENLLTKCLPDWRKRKKRLEQTIIT